MKKCGYCKKEIKPYAKYDLTEPIEDWLVPEEDRVIVDRKSWLNPMNTRKVNFEYIEAKKLFRTAQDTKSRDDWIAAFEQYAHYYADVYAYDIDGLSEFGEICTHLAQTAKDRSKESLYDRALQFYDLSNERRVNNPFYHIRVGENYARRGQDKEALKKFEELYKKDPNNKTYLLNCAILCVKVGKKEIENLKKYTKEFARKYPNDIHIDTLQTSIKKLQRNDTPSDISIKYTKGKSDKKDSKTGKTKTYSVAAQRIGVLLLLYIFPSLSKNQIRDHWLGNAETTTNVLNDLEEKKAIYKIRTLPATKYLDMMKNDDIPYEYMATELGKSYAWERVNSILHIRDDPKKDQYERKIEWHSEITDELAEKFIEWLAFANVATLKFRDRDGDWIYELVRSSEDARKIEEEYKMKNSKDGQKRSKTMAEGLHHEWD
tara:strand:+ start:55 stop:1350 length:1296 start_codon:yes stop_codon:yes gene_type:complete